MKKFFAALAVATLMAPVAASAATMKGEFWDVAPNTIANVDQAIAAVGGGTAATTATFTSTGISYGDGPGWSIGSLSAFLNADAGSIVGTDVGSIQESVFRLSGLVSVKNGDVISVTSDDGFRLIIGGTLVSEFNGLRGPNSTTNGTWTGADGIYSATLWYFEGNVTQAQLISNLQSFAVVPVPASALLLLTALGGGVGAGALRRRRAQK